MARSPQEITRGCSTTLRLLGLLYLTLAGLLLFAQGPFLYALNFAPKVFSWYQVLPDPAESLWTGFAAAHAVLLSGLVFVAAQNPAAPAPALLHLLSKVASAGIFTFLFLRREPVFAYLAVAIVEALLFLLSAWLWARAGVAGRKKNGTGGTQAPEDVPPTGGQVATP
ncbi:MAG TPA: hypothetical protein VL588_06580 [Bdellovibrionota bacterium]|jgi:hypothetical protein|nr:hypothetical protein [Bdellovibrionota bacterium]